MGFCFFGFLCFSFGMGFCFFGFLCFSFGMGLCLSYAAGLLLRLVAGYCLCFRTGFRFCTGLRCSLCQSFCLGCIGLCFRCSSDSTFCLSRGSGIGLHAGLGLLCGSGIGLRTGCGLHFDAGLGLLTGVGLCLCQRLKVRSYVLFLCLQPLPSRLSLTLPPSHVLISPLSLAFCLSFS